MMLSRELCYDVGPLDLYLRAQVSTSLYKAMKSMLTVRMPTVCVIDMLDLLTRLGHHYSGAIPIGTIMSGTDLIMPLLTNFAELLDNKYGFTIVFDHLFSCDKKIEAQTFIEHNFVPKHIYGSLEAMLEDDPEDIHGTDAPLRHVGILFTCVACDDYSNLNSKHSTSQGCYEDNRGVSGVTGNLVVQLVARIDPLFVLTENVKNWDAQKDKERDSDYTKYAKALNKQGRHSEKAVVCPKQHHCPHSRARVLAWANKESTSPIDQVATDGTMTNPMVSRYASCIEMLRSPADERFLVDEFLFDDDSEAVMSWQAERMELKAVEVARKAKAAAKAAEKGEAKDIEAYLVKHLEIYRNNDVEWPPSYDSDPSWRDRMAYLPDRQKECAWFYKVVAQRLNLALDVITDLNLSLDWSLSCFNDPPHIACLATTSRPYSVLREREVCGEEALQMQGLHRSCYSSMCDLSNAKLIDLAGDAYNGFALAAALFAGLACSVHQNLPAADFANSTTDEYKDDFPHLATPEEFRDGAFVYIYIYIYI
jgi:site-specific DNA-cytosine methylase